MGESYPRRDQARGLWNIKTITNNIIEEGTYPQAGTNSTALVAGGNTPSVSNNVDQFNMITSGNASDFGDLSVSMASLGSNASNIRMVCSGGENPSASNVMQYVHFVNQGNYSDFGDLGTAQGNTNKGTGNSVKAVTSCGSGDTDLLQTFNFATLGNATSFGNLTAVRNGAPLGVTNGVVGVYGGGMAPNQVNTIDFINISTNANATDFGDLTVARGEMGSVDSSTRGIFMGGRTNSPSSGTRLNTIDFIEMSSLGNAVDFGDLTEVKRNMLAGTSNKIKGFCSGGSGPSGNVNTIENFTIATRSNGADFGDLTVAKDGTTGQSGSHGGLQEFHPRAPELYSPTGKVVPRGGGVGDLGFHYGGSGPSDVNTIGVVQISTLGNTEDFGDLTAVAKLDGGGSSATRGIRGGGQNPSTTVNTIDYWEMASKGNAADFGDLTVARRSMLGQAGNDTRGLFQGGNTPSESNVIDYITFATIGNATDFGDCVENMNLGGAVSSNTRGLNAGGTGPAPSYSVTIGYVTIASTGNATDFGDLTVARYAAVNVGSSTRGVFMGGYVPSPTTRSNVMDYVTIASTGNATDFGDIDSGRAYGGQASNQTRGLYMGGENSGSGNTANIQYITIASTGNSASFGDLFEQNMQYFNGCSNGHGGLS